MSRVLLVPAAGRGSRLGMALPKLLVPVNGRPMIDHVLERYADLVDRTIVIVAPVTAAMVRDHLLGRPEPTELAIQPSPTGMLDAILAPAGRLVDHPPDEVWITWCDQVAVRAGTVAALAAALAAEPAPALAFPTVTTPEPYIHFARDGSGRISRVLQRREGDSMPPVGEGDLGLFGMTYATYHEALSDYAATAGPGDATHERNFLPFIPWLARRAPVASFPAGDPEEAIGINTPEDLARVGAVLHERGAGE
jgi:bifunctional UDP-N-acetylglucosamine pyrophosphorylase / glucosamine-1-phosphate N-acetyltransferase